MVKWLLIFCGYEDRGGFDHHVVGIGTLFDRFRVVGIVAVEAGQDREPLVYSYTVAPESLRVPGKE
jgi:hypothetical protein